MKRVSVTFDYEGVWGMIYSSPYDLRAVTEGLLEVLRRHRAKAVFFTVGKLLEEHPGLIRQIHAEGHEIGSHGYRHEHHHAFTPRQLAEFAENLASSAHLLEELTGERPRGFRAPYLMGPKFYDEALYRVLAETGYTWASNLEIRQPEEIFRPDRINRGLELLELAPVRTAALVALNPGLLRREHCALGGTVAAARWLTSSQAPVTRPNGITEYPLSSPLDCDLLGLPKPEDRSGEAFTSYARRVLISAFDRSGDDFNLNCHDWIIGTGDRLRILDDVLTHISARPDARYFLPGRNEEAS